MKKVVRVGAYIRVSSDRQLIEHGSLETQEDQLRKLVAQKNAQGGGQWEIVKFYREEGASGKSLKRPQMQQVLADVKAGRLDCLAVTRLDRLSRSIPDFVSLVELLKKHDVDFVSIREQFDSTTPMGRLLYFLTMALAAFEREIISERTKAKCEWRATSGLWHGGAQPLGYNVLPEGKGLEVNEAEKKVVELIFRTYLKTNSIRVTARRINDMGFRTKAYTGRSGKSHGGKPYAKNNIVEILTSHLVCGKCEYKGEVHPGKHPAIIDESLFLDVQARLRLNGVKQTRTRDKVRHVNLLEGLITCSKCQGPMGATWSVGALNTVHRYYVCKNQQDCKICDVKRVNADELEDVIAKRIVELSDTPKLLAKVLDKQNVQGRLREKDLKDKILALTASQAGLEGQIANLINYIAQGGDGASVKSKLTELEVQKGDLDREIKNRRAELAGLKEEVVQHDTALAALDFFSKAYEKASREQKKQLFQLLIESIQFNPEKIRITLYDIDLQPQDAKLQLQAQNVQKGAGLFQHTNVEPQTSKSGSRSTEQKDWLPD